MKTEQIQDLHKRVWTFRADMADVWPTPDTLDSLRFAFTEAGEAMDAYLRTRGGYARNNVKEPDLFGELADCALMLLTALGETSRFPRWASHVAPNLAEIGLGIAETLFNYQTGDRFLNFDSYIIGVLHGIAAYPGMDLAAELDKRMTRIAAKHGRTYG